MAARILDIAGLVVNRNTIPGDKTAVNASGIRLGTPWMTQRGLEGSRHEDHCRRDRRCPEDCLPLLG